MNPDSQNPANEPEENGGMPQAPTTGTGDDQTTPPVGGGNDMPEAPEAPEAPEGEETPDEGAPAPDESDKADGAKW